MRPRIAGCQAYRLAEGLGRLRVAVTLAQRACERAGRRAFTRAPPPRLAKGGAGVRGTALALEREAEPEVRLEVGPQRERTPENVRGFCGLALLEEGTRQLEQCVRGFLRGLSQDILGVLRPSLAAKDARQGGAGVRITRPQAHGLTQRHLRAREVAAALESECKAHMGLGVVGAVPYSLTKSRRRLRVAGALEEHSAELGVGGGGIRAAHHRLAQLALGGLGTPLPAQHEGEI